MRVIALRRVAPCQAWGLTTAWRRPRADDHGYPPEGWVQTALPRGTRGSVAARRPRADPGGRQPSVAGVIGEFNEFQVNLAAMGFSAVK